MNRQEGQQALPPPHPLRLEEPGRSFAWWSYPLRGFFLGAIISVLVGHPLAMVVFNFQEYIQGKASFHLLERIFLSFTPRMWPMMTLYALSGGIFGAILGNVFQKLQEHHLQLQILHQEFELQVASLRHHYKNLTIGIGGFSARVRRKVIDLGKQIRQGHGDGCPIENCYCHNLPALEKEVETLADTTQRLNDSLGRELTFLKALTSNQAAPGPHDLYPILLGAIRELLGVRFRGKELKVGINGLPYDACQDSLVFNFEAVTMEVILENILSNAMKYGDQIQVNVAATAKSVQIAVLDNGPGFEVEELRQQLLAPRGRRELGSTQLGLRVTLHLLENCGGQMLVASQPGIGSNFTLEFPN
jgi:signal transduction histidine kinase